MKTLSHKKSKQKLLLIPLLIFFFFITKNIKAEENNLLQEKKFKNTKFGILININLFRPDIGLFYEYGFTNLWGVRTGLFYDIDGFDVAFNTIDGKQVVTEFRCNLLNYSTGMAIDGTTGQRCTLNQLELQVSTLSIPIIARFYPFQTDFCIFLGPKIDFVIEATCIKSTKIPRKNYSPKYKQENINAHKKLSNGENFTNRLRLCFVWGIDWETWFGLIYGFQHTTWLTKLVNADPDYMPYKEENFVSSNGAYKISFILGVNISAIINIFTAAPEVKK